MEVKVENEWTAGHLIDLQREQILRVNHEYQRGLRWVLMQKCLFIDSIFRGYSIPAFYFHLKQTSAGSIINTHYDIVDKAARGARAQGGQTAAEGPALEHAHVVRPARLESHP